MATRSVQAGATPRARETTASGSELEARLDRFFKDSPWKIVVKRYRGKDWYAFIRHIHYTGTDAARQEGTPIYLAEVSEQAPIFKVAESSGEPNLFLIPVKRAYSRYVLNTEYNILQPEGSSSFDCTYPGYIVIPQIAAYVPPEIVVGEFSKFSVGQISVDESDEGNIIVKEEDGRRYPGVLFATSVECIPEDERDQIEREAIPKICAVFDASLSMNRFSSDYQYYLAAKKMMSYFTTDRLLTDIRSEFSDHGIEGVESFLRRQRVSLIVYKTSDSMEIGEDTTISHLDIWKLDELNTALESGESIRGAVDYAKLASLYSQLVTKIARKREYRPYMDPELGRLGRIFDEECDGSYVFISDSTRQTIPVPAAVEVSASGLGWEYGSSSERIPLNGAEIAPKRSLEANIPLFLQIYLDDGEPGVAEKFSDGAPFTKLSDEARRAIEHYSTQDDPDELMVDLHMRLTNNELYYLIGRISQLPEEKRSGLYDRLIELLTDGMNIHIYDHHIQRRIIATLTSWAFNGDELAREKLVDVYIRRLFPWKKKHLLDSEYDWRIHLDPSTTLYLAKAVSLLLTEDETKKIHSLIVDHPSRQVNTDYLIALSGKPEFADALRVMVQEGWGSSLVTRAQRSKGSGISLTDALSVVFSDPILLYAYPEEIEREDMDSLVGHHWDDAVFQSVYQHISGDLVPILNKKLSGIIGLIVYFAHTIMRPEWKKAQELTLNPFPGAMFQYDMETAHFENKLFDINRDARLEEHWTVATIGDRSVEFESGTFATEGSVFIEIDWGHVRETLLDEFSVDYGHEDDDVLFVDHHNHPWSDTSIPEEIGMIPSDTDLVSWFKVLVKTRARYPKAKMEFRITSTLGLTVVRPSEWMIKLADREILRIGRENIMLQENIEEIEFKKQTGIRLPDGLSMQIGRYGKHINEALGLYDREKVRSILEPYFDIDFRFAKEEF